MQLARVVHTRRGGVVLRDEQLPTVPTPHSRHGAFQHAFKLLLEVILFTANLLHCVLHSAQLFPHNRRDFRGQLLHNARFQRLNRLRYILGRDSKSSEFGLSSAEQQLGMFQSHIRSVESGLQLTGALSFSVVLSQKSLAEVLQEVVLHQDFGDSGVGLQH